MVDERYKLFSEISKARFQSSPSAGSKTFEEEYTCSSCHRRPFECASSRALRDACAAEWMGDDPALTRLSRDEAWNEASVAWTKVFTRRISKMDASLGRIV